MDSILWLPSWYPNRTDAFTGDFIERHALAVSRFTKLVVLYITKDDTLKNNSSIVTKSVNGNLVVYKVYYGRSGWDGKMESLFSFRRYQQLQKKVYQQIVEEHGQPKLVHVHVAMKAGLLALWLNEQFHIPFLLTEHWSGYNPDADPNIYDSNFLLRTFAKKLFKAASLFLPVSDNLGKVVNRNFVSAPYKVVPNVVNTELFFYQPSKRKRFRFIHPSFMGTLKNPEGILEACSMVQEKGYDFELLMLGTAGRELIALSEVYKLNDKVIFESLVSYEEVATRMQQSDALLMFSRFEGLPCVILEALCTGLPVISSRVGGIPEVVNDENGILVKSEDVRALSRAMIYLLEHPNEFDRMTIAIKARSMFDYDTVGQQYMRIYENFL